MGIHKSEDRVGSIACILLTALFSVLAVSGCAKTEDGGRQCGAGGAGGTDWSELP